MFISVISNRTERYLVFFLSNAAQQMRALLVVAPDLRPFRTSPLLPTNYASEQMRRISKVKWRQSTHGGWPTCNRFHFYLKKKDRNKKNPFVAIDYIPRRPFSVHIKMEKLNRVPLKAIKINETRLNSVKLGPSHYQPMRFAEKLTRVQFKRKSCWNPVKHTGTS